MLILLRCDLVPFLEIQRFRFYFPAHCVYSVKVHSKKNLKIPKGKSKKDRQYNGQQKKRQEDKQ